MSKFIQLHFLTAYPPANLNRDDLGRPKTAIFGGAQRLRVSSQSLKRAWRCSDVFQKSLEGAMGQRTKEIGNIAFGKMTEAKVDPERAHVVAREIASVFGKVKAESKKDKEKQEQFHSGESRQTEQLVFISVAEMAALDELLKRVEAGEDPDKTDYEALLSNGYGSADIAMFGRMLAAKPKYNVEAAAQIAHALSVDKVTVEDDFFTAVDDLNTGEEDLGAGHMGTTEFGAGLFYTYICINDTLLHDNLNGNGDLAKASVRALIEAATTVSPTGKQATFASRARAVYLLAEVGSQQPRSLAVAFIKPVRDQDPLEAAVKMLEETRANMDKVYGPCADRQASFNVRDGTGSLEEVTGFVNAYQEA